MCLTTSHGFLCKSVPKVERYTFGTLVVHSCVSALWRRRLRVLGTDRCQPARAWSLWHVGVGRGDAQRRTIGSEQTEGKSGHKLGHRHAVYTERERHRRCNDARPVTPSANRANGLVHVSVQRWRCRLARADPASGAGRSPSGHSASGHRVATRFSQCAPSPREGETKLASELSRRASGP